MILAKIAFDAKSQQFRLTDPEVAAAFQDGETYLVIIDFLPKQLERNLELSQNKASDFDLVNFRDSPPLIGNA